MSNLVDEISKYSCNCHKCQEEKSSFYDQKGIPTNMSITDCENPKLFDCYNNLPFLSNIEPNNEGGFITINPSVIHNKYSTGFQFKDYPKNQKSSVVQYASKDPRLKSIAGGGEPITLDKPPYDSKVILSEIISDSNLNRYGQNYKTYSDINAGHIIYYVNKSRQDPFNNPVFSTSAQTTGSLYRDPMGSIKPIYEREPFKNHNPHIMKDFYDGGLSWIRDSQEHREDLVSKQMIKRNQERWEPRWKV